MPYTNLELTVLLQAGGNTYTEVLGNATIDLCANTLVETYTPGGSSYSETLGNAKIDMVAGTMHETVTLVVKGKDVRFAGVWGLQWVDGTQWSG